MRKKNIIVFLAILMLIALLSLILIVVFSKKEDKNIESYDFTNKVFHYGGYIENNNYQQTYIFMKDGTYYNFTNQYDEECTLRSSIGTWSQDNDKVNISLEYAIFYDGGKLVKSSDDSYFGVKRENYNLIKKNYEGVTALEFQIGKGQDTDRYKDYLIINSNIYYPIYEFDTEDDLYEKLTEMYGKVFTMLSDENMIIEGE